MSDLTEIKTLTTEERLKSTLERLREKHIATGKPLPDTQPLSCPLGICGGAKWLKHYTNPAQPWQHELVPCECSREDFLTKERMREQRPFLVHCTLESQHAGQTFTSLTPDSHNRQAAAVARRFCDSPRGILTYLGPAGTGKTFLAACIAWRLRSERHTVLWLNTTRFFDHLRASYQPQQEGGDTFDEKWEAAIHVPVLCLDDWGAQKMTEYVKERMLALIDERYNRNAATVITTNLTADDMDVGVLGRLSEIARGNTMVVLAGTDRRLNRTSQEASAYYDYDGTEIICRRCGVRPCLCQTRQKRGAA